MSREPYSILLTIDVEDWFQVENFKECIPFSSWPSHTLRVKKNTHRILDLLDSIRIGKIEATFFVLAWIAERLPHLVREIDERGHEVASHGYYHRLCNQESRDALKKDLADSKKLLEDIIGKQVYGYRAPSFSVNNEVLKMIAECGYLYDSSYNSFALNKRYGMVDLSRNGDKGIAFKISAIGNPQRTTDNGQRTIDNLPCGKLYELPISNLALANHILPWGGGGYFRLIPSPLFKMGVKLILKKKRAYLFYIHPWEVDPKQPRVNEASLFYKFRHYQNLNTTYGKLQRFIESFEEHRFVTCRQYLEAIPAA